MCQEQRLLPSLTGACDEVMSLQNRDRVGARPRVSRRLTNSAAHTGSRTNDIRVSAAPGKGKKQKRSPPGKLR